MNFLCFLTTYGSITNIAGVICLLHLWKSYLKLLMHVSIPMAARTSLKVISFYCIQFSSLFVSLRKRKDEISWLSSLLFSLISLISVTQVTSSALRKFQITYTYVVWRCEFKTIVKEIPCRSKQYEFIRSSFFYIILFLKNYWKISSLTHFAVVSLRWPSITTENTFTGNTFLVPGATVATLLMLGALHARRLYDDKKVHWFYIFKKIWCAWNFLRYHSNDFSKRRIIIFLWDILIHFFLFRW